MVMIKNVSWVFILLLMPIFLWVIMYADSEGYFTASNTGSDRSPTVSVAHSVSGDIVTVTATASDENGVKMLNVYVDGVEMKSCAFSGLANVECVYSGTFSSGTHSYKALASDGKSYVATSDKTFQI